MDAPEQGTLEYTSLQIILFFGLTFVISWSMFIPAVNFLQGNRQTLLIILGAFGPFAAAVIVIWTSKGRTELYNWLRQMFRLRCPIFWYLSGAFILPIGIGILQYLLYIALGGETDFTTALPWYFYLIALIPTALLAGGNEEPGWRGFALPALLKWLHPVMASLILGFIHGAWHLPLMSHYGTTFGWYLFNIIPLSFLLNWFYLKSRESIYPVMLFHAGTNVIGDFIPMPMDVIDGVDTWMMLRGIVYWCNAIIILLITRGKLGSQ